MEIVIDIRKDLKKNAAYYFEKSKKAKKKIVGTRKIIEKSKDQLEKLNKKQQKLAEEQLREQEKKEKEPKKEIKKEWYENFRWFISSEGFLCVGGKDATTNDILIKKHTNETDIVFHTEMPGSPFFVIKTEKGKKPTEITLREVAQATVSFSKSWKLGLGTAEVYAIMGSQVKKKFGLPKGSFMIEGKRNYFSPKLELAIGLTKDHKVMAGPLSAVKKHCTDFVQIVQGDEKTSDLAKQIKQKIHAELDDIIRAMPAGGAQIKK